MQLRAKLSTDFHQYDQSTRVSSLGAPTPMCHITKKISSDATISFIFVAAVQRCQCLWTHIISKYTFKNI